MLLSLMVYWHLGMILVVFGNLLCKGGRDCFQVVAGVLPAKLA